LVGQSINDLWVYAIDQSCGICSANPIAVFSAPSEICPGTCIDFTNNSINASSYSWSFPGGNPSVSTDAVPMNICYNTPGNYDVTLIATNANGADTLLLTNYITVFPQPPPQGILQNGDTLFANPGAVSYQWYYNGNLIPGATNYFYVATGSGDYNVVATDENDCEVEAVINDVIAAVGSSSMQSIQIYPNPVTSSVDIRGLKDNSEYEITILNVFGEKVFSAVNCNLPIANCSFSPGLYYIEIIADKKIYRMKFMKQ
jgi:PKD repeat protein